MRSPIEVGLSSSSASGDGGSQGDPSIDFGAPLVCLHAAESHAATNPSRIGAGDGAARGNMGRDGDSSMGSFSEVPMN